MERNSSVKVTRKIRENWRGLRRVGGGGKVVIKSVTIVNQTIKQMCAEEGREAQSARGDPGCLRKIYRDKMCGHI